MGDRSTRFRRKARAQESADLHARLQARRPALEPAVLTRVQAIADPAERSDPTYAEGQRAAVSAAIDYGLAVMGAGERLPRVPVAIFAQARLAARLGVSIDAVLRRYTAGYALFGDLVIEEAEAAGIPSSQLKRLHRAQATALDRLLAAVGEEYGHESEAKAQTPARRQLEQVERLLAGEMLEPPELAYDLDAWHIGIVVAGDDASAVLRPLAEIVDRRLLLVEPENRRTWAWLGGRRRLDLDPIVAELSTSGETGRRFAIGQPGEGPEGWRLSHRQAAAALPICQGGHTNPVRYADVALLASVRQDDLLAASLRQIYLAPLEGARNGGEEARRTLRAYFAADRNASSTAAALGVSRRTVSSRLRAIEERLERPLPSCAAELEAALRLDDLTAHHLSLSSVARS